MALYDLAMVCHKPFGLLFSVWNANAPNLGNNCKGFSDLEAAMKKNRRADQARTPYTRTTVNCCVMSSRAPVVR